MSGSSPRLTANRVRRAVESLSSHAHPPVRGREASLVELLSLAGWRHFVPETVGLLAVVLVTRAVLPPTFHTPVGIPGPFWIPVLLIAAQYGIMGGLFATLGATVAFAADGILPQSASQDFYAYAAIIAAQPCAWFATALVLGGLRTLHIHHYNALRSQLDRSERAADDLAVGVEDAAAEIRRLELRIASESDTLTNLLRSLSRLDVSSGRAVGDSVCDFIGYGVGATSFALFLRVADKLVPCLGVEDGARVAVTAVAPIMPSLLRDIEGSVDRPAELRAHDTDNPLWAPIRLAYNDALVGVLICYRLQPVRDLAFASRRLGEVCRVLAVLLAATPDVRVKSVEA